MLRRVWVRFVPFLCSARRYRASSTSWAFHRRAAPLCPPSSSPQACHPGCYLQGEDGGEDLQRLPGAIRAAEWKYYVGVSGVRGDVYFVCLFFVLFFKLHTTTNTNGVKRVHKTSKDGRKWIRVAAYLLVFTRKKSSGKNRQLLIHETKNIPETLGRCASAGLRSKTSCTSLVEVAVFLLVWSSARGDN